MTTTRGLNRTVPMEHSGRNGTRLFAKRLDLTGKNILIRPANITDAQFAADVSEIIGWWTLNVREEFLKDGQGWGGFDGIRYEVHLVQDCIEVEFDREYRGGNYKGVGEKVNIPVSLIDEAGNLSADDVGAAFNKMTGLDPIHIVHYSNEVVQEAIPEST